MALVEAQASAWASTSKKIREDSARVRRRCGLFLRHPESSCDVIRSLRPTRAHRGFEWAEQFDFRPQLPLLTDLWREIGDRVRSLFDRAKQRAEAGFRAEALGDEADAHPWRVRATLLRGNERAKDAGEFVGIVRERKRAPGGISQPRAPFRRCHERAARSQRLDGLDLEPPPTRTGLMAISNVRYAESRSSTRPWQRALAGRTARSIRRHTLP
jgi:hypothetical protein